MHYDAKVWEGVDRDGRAVRVVVVRRTHSYQDSMDSPRVNQDMTWTLCRRVTELGCIVPDGVIKSYYCLRSDLKLDQQGM